MAHPASNKRPQPFRFGHTQATLAFWRRLVTQSIGSIPTPFFIFALGPIREALAELKSMEAAIPLPVRHWLSFKTQPLLPLVSWWQRQGSGVEVVSEFELLAALQEGFPPDRILVNGPAKHRWLPRYPIQGLRVNIDSTAEALALLPQARKLNWSLGVRCQTSQESARDHPETETQFGMPRRELVPLLRRWLGAGVRVETVHFHLRTNVPSASIYERAIVEVAEVCRAAGFGPRHLDVGGGFPAHHILSRGGRPYDAEFSLRAFSQVAARAREQLPDIRELWIENGRFVSARSGVLVLRVLDVKEREGQRFLICDGGRTMNALISTWETHGLFSVPRRAGPSRMTAVCGPTCMAFDQLTRQPLSGRLRVGDHLVWLDAGAYHIPWETCFSHGYAGVLWHDDDRLEVVRAPQSFEDWWGRWRGCLTQF